jgi:ABC-2 type transport system ATP-binding protein
MDSPDGVLELTDLRRRFGDVVALDGLSFVVPRGEVFGFLGPNGSGKTTAMRAIVGVTSLDGGSVRWSGAPIGHQARRRIGYMPEERRLYATMTVHDQLAAALVHEPGLLVLDEPFSGLDPVGVDAMSEVLAERAAAEVTMLFSSHQLDLVEHLCTSVVIIHQGALVAYGTVEDLARGGRLRVAVRVTGDDQAAWTSGLGGVAAVEQISHGTVTLALDSEDDAQAVLDLARRAGPVEQFGFVRRRLSEVFREAVGADADAVGASAPAREKVGR